MSAGPRALQPKQLNGLVLLGFALMEIRGNRDSPFQGAPHENSWQALVAILLLVSAMFIAWVTRRNWPEHSSVAVPHTASAVPVGTETAALVAIEDHTIRISNGIEMAKLVDSIEDLRVAGKTIVERDGITVVHLRASADLPAQEVSRVMAVLSDAGFEKVWIVTGDVR